MEQTNPTHTGSMRAAAASGSTFQQPVHPAPPILNEVPRAMENAGLNIFGALSAMSARIEFNIEQSNRNHHYTEHKTSAMYVAVFLGGILKRCNYHSCSTRALIF